MTAPKIRLQGVRKQFGAKVVLDGVDLDVMAGESVVIIGGSGSGKSVTLKCILGLMTPAQMCALDLYVAVMTRWRPGRKWFTANTPRLLAIGEKASDTGGVADVIKRNFG